MSDRPLFIQSPLETIEALRDIYFPPYITLAHLFHAPIGWHIRDRILSQYQIQYCCSGTAEYRINNQTYITKPGDLLFHRPNERHSVKPVGPETYVCMSIVFHFGSTSFPVDELVQSNAMGNFSGHTVERMLTSVIVNYRQPGLKHQLSAQKLLFDILLELNHHQHEREAQKSSSTQKNNLGKMILVKNYLIEHFDEPVEIKDLAALVGLNRDYLVLQFKRTFNITPIQYLIQLRVEKAKELAVQRGLKVTEIAQLVGYSDVHTFGRIFKMKTGVSLSQFCASLFKDDPNPDEH